METAALCKYLWCNISMWIDFLPNPSIITGISWKPTSRRWLRAFRKLRQERRVPLSFKVFVFLLTGGSPAARAFHVSAAPLSFQADFKACFSLLFLWRGRWTWKCPNRKMCCRSIYRVVPVEKKKQEKKEGIIFVKTESPGYCLTVPSVHVVYIFIYQIVEKNEIWGKKYTRI